MPKAKDYAGTKFGCLTAVRLNGYIKHGAQPKRAWLCRCDCGKELRVQAGALSSGNTKSCGCKSGGARHGASGTPTYNVWHSMLQRCNYPGDQAYPDYGARGIVVCEPWRAYEHFIADMGDRPPGCSLDRIDVNGPYSPSNCRWATPMQQANNRRNNRTITYAGRTQTTSEWAREAGVSKSGMLHRLKAGWTLHDALTRPPSRTANATASRRNIL